MLFDIYRKVGGSQCVLVDSRFGVYEASIRLAETIASDVSLLMTFNHDLGLRYQTMGISGEKIEYSEGLRSEDNLFRAALEQLVGRVE